MSATEGHLSRAEAEALIAGWAAEAKMARVEAETFAAGWAAGAKDTATPAIRQRWVACGLGLHLAGAAQPQDEPLDAA